MYSASRHSPSFGSEAKIRYLALSEMIRTGKSLRQKVRPVPPAVNRRQRCVGDTNQIGAILAVPCPRSVAVGTRKAERILLRQAIGLLALALAYLNYNYLDVKLLIITLPSIDFFL